MSNPCITISRRYTEWRYGAPVSFHCVAVLLKLVFLVLLELTPTRLLGLILIHTEGHIKVVVGVGKLAL